MREDKWWGSRSYVEKEGVSMTFRIFLIGLAVTFLGVLVPGDKGNGLMVVGSMVMVGAGIGEVIKFAK